MTGRRAGGRALPIVFFALSGFSGLIYEIVWTRKLVLVFGGTIHSVSTVLSGFMAGFALGALWGARLSRRTKDPWRLYGLLELGVAGTAALFPLCARAMPLLLERLSWPHGPARFILAFASLLPAAFLMGATFPVLAQYRIRSDRARGTGELYAANLIGACLGALSGAFVLLAFLGLSGTHWTAVLVNASVGSAVLLLPRPPAEPPPAETAVPTAPPAPPFLLSAGVFLSGLCGMAYEVVWTRFLQPSFNNSAYGFASVLFVFLLGLGGGSWLAGRWKRRPSEREPGPAALGLLLLLCGLYGLVGHACYELTQGLQLRFCGMADSGVRPVILIPLLEALAVLGPLAALQGMVLPTAMGLAGSGEKPGSSLGRLYFWNTLGGIAGSLAAGFWWIPSYNVQNALLIVASVGLFSGALIASYALPGGWKRALPPVAASLMWTAAWTRLRDRHLPAQLLLEWSGRGLDRRPDLLYYSDDPEASVAVLRRSGGRYLVINGVGVSSYTNATKMMAHIPLLLHPRPERVLVICFGLGTTFRSALRHPVRVEVVDLVPSVLRVFPLFYPDAARWTSDPRAALLVNDGRNHLLADREGYDVIIADPSPPLYAAGTVNLYSRDFYSLARRRLKPGGIAAVWIPGYPEPEFRMVMKSFTSAFPHVQVWRGTSSHNGLVMLGGSVPIPLDPGRVGRRLADPGIRSDMLQFDREFQSEGAFWSLYQGSGERFRNYLEDSPEVTDDFPRIEYPYFRSLRRSYYKEPAIFRWPSASGARTLKNMPIPRILGGFDPLRALSR